MRIQNQLTHGSGDSANLTPDASIAEHADTHADRVPDTIVFLGPFVLLLSFVELVVLVSVNEMGHDDPLGNLRSMHTRRSRDRNVGICVDGMSGKLV